MVARYLHEQNPSVRFSGVMIDGQTFRSISFGPIFLKYERMAVSHYGLHHHFILDSYIFFQVIMFFLMLQISLFK